MKKSITIYNGTVLEEGKKYLWSGHTTNQYDRRSWANFRCKIRKIDGVEVTIYDYENRDEYIFTDNGFVKVEATFTPIETLGFFKKLFKS